MSSMRERKGSGGGGIGRGGAWGGAEPYRVGPGGEAHLPSPAVPSLEENKRCLIAGRAVHPPVKVAPSYAYALLLFTGS